jgi:hypothetical protein
VEAEPQVIAKLREKMAAASSAKPAKLIMHKKHEAPRKAARPAARPMRPARPTMMRTPRMPKGLELLQAPLSRSFALPTR